MATYNKDQSKILNSRPLKSMLIILVWRIISSRYIVSDASAGQSALFDEYVRDEAVDDRRAGSGKRSGPDNNTRSGQNLKGVQHGNSRGMCV